MLQEVFRDNAMSESKTFLWYKRFKDGRTSVDDNERSGRLSTSTTPANIAKAREAILADRRQTIHDVCEIVGLSYGTVQRILADNFNMRRKFARFVPRLLSDDQKALRISVCSELKQQARDDPKFISSSITVDETWVYDYDPETKQQLSQWKSPNSPWLKRAHQVRCNIKSMLIVFFWHPRHCPQGICTPWSNRQLQILLWGFEVAEGGQLVQTSRQVEEKQLVSPPWQSACPLNVWQFLTSKNITLIPQPPFAWLRPLWLFPIPQDESTAETASFWHDWRDPRRNARGNWHSHISELPGMHEIMGNTLGLLYIRTRGLLRRRQWKLGVTVRNFFFMVKFPEFLGSPT